MAKANRTTKHDSKVGDVMHEFKEGTLESSSGQKVRSRKQAIAIGLSEAREAGEDVPPPPKKSSKKSASSKKSPVKKAAASKKSTAPKKSAAPRKSAAPKKSSAKK